VGLADVLLGRKKLKEPAGERLFALSTAQVTLETELGLKSSGGAALTFKPLSGGDFSRADADIEELLAATAKSSGSTVERKTDSFGYQWVIVRDPDFEDLVTSVHLVASELQAKGFGGQLLAAVFRFEGKEHPVYWIYGYKRGAFWPFVPTGSGQERDNAEELALKAKLEPELPIEPDISRWFALFDAPV
jgi:hypothetical protein